MSTLRVLRLHGYDTTYKQPAPAATWADAFANGDDGRWDRLQVLDLNDCRFLDSGLRKLAEYIADGCFGAALEEIDLSVDPDLCPSVEPRSTLGGPVDLHALVKALNARGEGMRLKRLKLNWREVGDDGVAELVAGWRDGTCFDALEELQLTGNELTDETLKMMVEEGMLCVPAGQQHQQPGQKKPPVLQRLELDWNEISTGSRLQEHCQQLLSVAGSSSWSSSLGQLSLGECLLGCDGLPALLACAALQELRLNIGGDNVVSGSAEDNNALARTLFDAATMTSGAACLRALRCLNVGSLKLSLAVVTEFTDKLRTGCEFPRLCQLNLKVDLGMNGIDVKKEEEGVEDLKRELIEARAPLRWDVLSI